jgi:hypothetical protein
VSPHPPYDETALVDPPYTAAEVDAALQELIEPGRLAHAQDVVTHAAPTLQRVLAESLAEGGWFEQAHDAEIGRVSAERDEDARARAVKTLVAEQTRLGMFVGAAVGFEMARQLTRARETGVGDPDTQEHGRESKKDKSTTEEH